MKRALIHIIYPAEFAMTYAVTYGKEIAEDASTENILENAFAAWNCGSGDECEQFISSRKRSLSVGDFVGVNGQYFRCDSYGWTPVTYDHIEKFEKRVANHEEYATGAWFAVQCLLHEDRELTVA